MSNTKLLPDGPLTRDHCLAFDRNDPLASCKARFALPEGVIYLDGNSLGALPASVARRSSSKG